VTLDGGIISTSSATSGDAGSVSVSAASLQLVNASDIISESLSGGAGNAGSIQIAAKDLSLTGLGTAISSAASGTRGNAGDVSIDTGGGVLVAGGARIDSTVGSAGRSGGAIRITAGGEVHVQDANSAIATDTLSQVAGVGRADIQIKAGSIVLEGQTAIESATFGAADAGNVTLSAPTISLSQTATVNTSTQSTGAAGRITINADAISLDQQASITSEAHGGAQGGAASAISLAGLSAPAVASLRLTNGSIVESSSDGVQQGGVINISAGDIFLQGFGTSIRSQNSFIAPVGFATCCTVANPLAAGDIQITFLHTILENGATISTDSNSGAAGEILLQGAAPSSTLWLRAGAGGLNPTITTSSGLNSGGRIFVDGVHAIISDGGLIDALGQINGALVSLHSDFFVRSSDKLNAVNVDGALVLNSQVQDVARGSEPAPPPYLEAGHVLIQRCQAVHDDGVTSAFAAARTGVAGKTDSSAAAGAAACGAH
jgi:large exoprotein involved in heme utilization and adhesion